MIDLIWANVWDWQSLESGNTADQDHIRSLYFNHTEIVALVELFSPLNRCHLLSAWLSSIQACKTDFYSALIVGPSTSYAWTNLHHEAGAQTPTSKKWLEGMGKINTKGKNAHLLF